MIKIYAVGGTIDKVYFDGKGQYQIGDPEIGKILEEGLVNIPYSITSICQKDSLDMTEEDREEIYKAIEQDDYRLFVLTHGTDTMVDTAKKLQTIKGKTIVLTGSMKPAKFKTSDATFNVGFALAAVQSLPEGVYIGMGGQIFHPDNTRKNREKSRFETLTSDY